MQSLCAMVLPLLVRMGVHAPSQDASLPGGNRCDTFCCFFGQRSPPPTPSARLERLPQHTWPPKEKTSFRSSGAVWNPEVNTQGRKQI